MGAASLHLVSVLTHVLTYLGRAESNWIGPNNPSLKESLQVQPFSDDIFSDFLPFFDIYTTYIQKPYMGPHYMLSRF